MFINDILVKSAKHLFIASAVQMQEVTTLILYVAN